MPKAETIPPVLKPYLCHGVDLNWHQGNGQSTGQCPFCNREGKFGVRLDDGRWRCLVCGAKAKESQKEGGNATSFLWALWEYSRASTKPSDYATLARDRQLMDPDTPKTWGACLSILTRRWILPGYNASGKMGQLYRYTRMPNGKSALLATAEMGHYLHGADLYDKEKNTVYLTEGPWDGMALWEVLGLTDPGGDWNVLAAPGCNVFHDAWLPLFSGKKVVVCYDSDHPRLRCPACKQSFSSVNHETCPKCQGALEGPEVPPAGYEGVKRVCQALAGCEEPPLSVSYLCWGEGGYDTNLPSGYDLRDALTGTPDPRVGLPKEGRRLAWSEVLGKIQHVPDKWLVAGPKGVKKGGPELTPLPCRDWNLLVQEWRKSMKWTEGLDRGLSVMLAVVVSTPLVGDPLWVKLVSPPSSGKSVLCEAVSVARKYVFPKDTMTSLFSGYQTDKEGTEDISLANRIDGKTLVVKDADTILQHPNLPQILSQLRALYDRAVRTSYGNKMSRNYEALNATVVLAGTKSIRKLDTSELGERFLDCVVVDEIDEALEDDVGWRVANDADRGMLTLVNGKAGSQEAPARVNAKRMTGGYVEYLRDNVGELVTAVDFPEESLKRCQHLAQFVAFVRARPSKSQDEEVEREMSFRLISQFVRLARCLAVVLGRSMVDGEVMRRVARTATDTARGRTMEIIRRLYKAGDQGLTVGGVSRLTDHPEDKERTLLRFLKKIKACDSFKVSSKGILKEETRWRLTPRLRRLYEEVNQQGIK